MPARPSASNSGGRSASSTLCGEKVCSLGHQDHAMAARRHGLGDVDAEDVAAQHDRGAALRQRIGRRERAAVSREAVEQRAELGERRRQVAAAAARDQQLVVADLLAVREDQHAPGRVDLGHPAFAPHGDPALLVVLRRVDQIVAPVALALEHLRQLVAVVEQQPADRDDRDPDVGIALAQHGRRLVAGDAVADDHVVLLCRHPALAPLRLRRPDRRSRSW